MAAASDAAEKLASKLATAATLSCRKDKLRFAEEIRFVWRIFNADEATTQLEQRDRAVSPPFATMCIGPGLLQIWRLEIGHQNHLPGQPFEPKAVSPPASAEAVAEGPQAEPERRYAVYIRVFAEALQKIIPIHNVRMRIENLNGDPLFEKYNDILFARPDWPETVASFSSNDLPRFWTSSFGASPCQSTRMLNISVEFMVKFDQSLTGFPTSPASNVFSGANTRFDFGNGLKFDFAPQHHSTIAFHFSSPLSTCETSKVVREYVPGSYPPGAGAGRFGGGGRPGGEIDAGFRRTFDLVRQAQGDDGMTSFSDVRLKCGGETFYGHRVVLAQRSDTFRRCFSNPNFAETQKGEVEIEDIEAEVFYELLRYLYCGWVEGLAEHLEPLIYAAEKYQVGGLSELCAQAILNQLSIENACHFLLIGDKFNLTKVRDEAAKMIMSDRKRAVGQDEWAMVVARADLITMMFTIQLD